MRLKILIDCGNSFLKWVLICEFYSIKRTYSVSGKLETEIFIKRKKERLLSTSLLESLKKLVGFVSLVLRQNSCCRVQKFLSLFSTQKQ
jgi:hypothetical protein